MGNLAEQMYQSRKSRRAPNLRTPTAASPPDSVITNHPPTNHPPTNHPPTNQDLSRERDLIQRFDYVFTRILEVIPQEARNDWRYMAFKTMIKESLKDLARIPDSVVIPMVEEFAQAMDFLAHGNMEELNKALENDDTI